MPLHEQNYIIDGLRHGFKILDCNDDMVPSYDAVNYNSAESADAKPIIDKIFAQELEERKLSKSNTKPKCIHSIGAVSKKGTTDLRPITDCKRPLHNSINSLMSYPKQVYKTIDTVTSYITLGCFFAVVDISKAFRAIPIFPNHRQYQGFRWMFGTLDRTQYDYYVDNFLCFGLACAPGIFSRISNAITSILNAKGINAIVNYIDDFILMAPTLADCIAAQHELIRTLGRLGFSVSWAKVKGPAQIMDFLGLTLNSITMEVSLPEDKLHKLQLLLNWFITHQKVQRRDLEQLVGILNHAASVVKGGRTFTRRILDAMLSVDQHHHYVRLTVELCKDIKWWQSFASTFNGKSKIIDPRPLGISAFQSDSSFSGFGIYWNGAFRFGTWHPDATCHVPQQYSDFHRINPNIPDNVKTNINFLELYPVLVAARLWGQLWRDKHIVVYTDNTQTMYFINKGTCKNHTGMAWLRELFWISAHNNFYITSCHLPGQDNVIADCLSRLAEPKAWQCLKDYVSFYQMPFFFFDRPGPITPP